MNFDLKIQRIVLNALQKIIEKFLVKSFETIYVLMLENFIALITIMINLFVIHVKRVTIQVKNMKLLNNLRFSMIEKNILNKFIFISSTN
jgi:histone H3/H4